MSGPLSTRHIEAAEEALETSFQALEIVGTAYVEPFKLTPYLSNTSLMIAKTMLKEGYDYGMGLILPLDLVVTTSTTTDGDPKLYKKYSVKEEIESPPYFLWKTMENLRKE